VEIPDNTPPLVDGLVSPMPTESPLVELPEDATAMAMLVEGDPYGIMTLDLFGANDLMLSAEEEPKDPTDLLTHMTGVTLQRKVGNEWVDVEYGETVNKNDQLRFFINYTVKPDNLTKEKNYLTYQLPEQLHLSKALSGNVSTPGGEVAGTYTISQNGEVRIEFNDEFVRRNQSEGDIKGSQIIAYLAVEAQVDSSSSDDNTVHVDFGRDDLVVEVPIKTEEENPMDLTVQKSGTILDEKNGTVEYTITVSSTTGTDNVVLLKDTMTDIGLDGDVFVNGQKVEITETEQGFELTLPKMDAGTTYTVTYRAKLPNAPVKADMSAKNKVELETVKQDGSKLTPSHEISTSFKQTYLYKSGELVSDADKIKWTITVNPGKHDISGWKLKDIFNGVDYTGSATLTDSAGNKKTITFPYIFPEGSKDIYTITYETSADKMLNEAVAKNQAVLTPPNGEPEINEGDNVNIGNDWEIFKPLKKTSESILVDKETKVATIRWRVTVDTKLGSLVAPWVYTDKLQSGQYFTDQQFELLKDSISSAIQAAGLKLDYDFIEIVENNQKIGYKLNFKTSMEKGKEFSFTYSSTGLVTDENKEQYFGNNANINEKVYEGATATYKPLVKKYDQSRNDGADTEHDYFDEVLDKNGVLKWGIDVNIPEGYNGGDLIVTEKLPEGVSLKQLSMSVEPDSVCTGSNITTVGSHVLDNKYTVTTEQDDRIITIVIPADLAQNEQLKKIKFSIQTQIDENFNWPKDDKGKFVSSFTNEVDVTSKDGTTHGTDVQTQTIKKDGNKELLTKSSGEFENNIIPYSIIINPDGVDLVEGSDELILEDTLKYFKYWDISANLVPNSVHVYKLEGENRIEIDPSQVPFTMKVIEAAHSNDYVRHVMTMTIPDETPLLIEYQYKFSGKISQYAYIYNTAKVSGQNVTEDSNQVEKGFNIVDSIAGAKIEGIGIAKVDAKNNGITLPNAKFELYCYNEETKQYDQAVLNSENGKEHVTDKSGTILFDNLKYNTAYLLREIEPPKGYSIKRAEYYFYIADDDLTKNPMTIPSGFIGSIYHAGETVYITNESDNTQIKVQKKWFSKSGDDITDTKSGSSIQFDLYQKESTAPTGTPGETVNIEWKGVLYENTDWFSQTKEVPIGSKVTIGVQPSGSVDFYEIPVSFNGGQVLLKREPDTLLFSYTFYITEDTNILVHIDHNNGGWQTAAYLFAGTTEHFDYEPPTQNSGSDFDDEGVLWNKDGPYTLSKDNNWTIRIKNLPKTGLSNGQKVYYSYYVKEQDVPNWDDSYDNNGAASGTITIKNTETTTPGHVLPSTGGYGTYWYTAGGALLVMAAGCLLMYRKDGRGKGDRVSS